MKELLSSGRLVDVALVAIAGEAAVLVWLRAKARRGMRLVDVLGHLLSGAFLLLALRAAVTGADYRITLAWMTASFPPHIFDLVRRARSASREAPP